MLRLIFWAILIYLALKLIQSLLMPPQRNVEVKGTPTTKKPLDLSDADIEDAKFEEIKED